MGALVSDVSTAYLFKLFAFQCEDENVSPKDFFSAATVTDLCLRQMWMSVWRKTSHASPWGSVLTTWAPTRVPVPEGTGRSTAPAVEVSNVKESLTVFFVKGH